MNPCNYPKPSDVHSSECDKEIAGWKPPIIYDVHIDQYRLVTQEDVDHLVRIAQHYGMAIDASRDVLRRHEELKASNRPKAQGQA